MNREVTWIFSWSSLNYRAGSLQGWPKSDEIWQIFRSRPQTFCSHARTRQNIVILKKNLLSTVGCSTRRATVLWTLTYKPLRSTRHIKKFAEISGSQSISLEWLNAGCRNFYTWVKKRLNFPYFRTPLANFLLSRPNSVEYGNSKTTIHCCRRLNERVHSSKVELAAAGVHPVGMIWYSTVISNDLEWPWMT